MFAAPVSSARANVGCEAMYVYILAHSYARPLLLASTQVLCLFTSSVLVCVRVCVCQQTIGADNEGE